MTTIHRRASRVLHRLPAPKWENAVDAYPFTMHPIALGDR
jgi:hypothetical protein